MKSVSDRYLYSKHSEYVRKSFGKCVVCGNSNYNLLECHHVVHRRHFLLRWFYANGVAVCSPSLTGNECHKFIDTLSGRELAQEKIIQKHGKHIWWYIKDMEQYVKKQYLVGMGMSENEFRKIKLAQLKQQLNNLEEE